MSHHIQQHEIPKDRFALIIGAAKSGTTSLYLYLIQHPEICPSIIKELEFFSERQSHSVRAEGIKYDRYEDLWDFDPTRHRYALEASTGYTNYPIESNVVDNIYSYGLKPKIIYIVRDPVDRIESAYRYHVRSLNSFERWSDPTSVDYIAKSNYHLQLSQYTKVFPWSSILVLEFSKLRDDPATLCNRMWDFLGVKKSFTPQFAKHNQTEVISPLEFNLLHKYMTPVFRFARKLPTQVKKIGRFCISRLLRDKVSLSDTQRTRIREILSEDMHKFESEFGIDVSQWGF